MTHYDSLIIYLRIEPNNSAVRFKATDNYPGPPLTYLKRMGNVRCPSYNRAVIGLYTTDRTPPPEYKLNRSGNNDSSFILDE